jgi:hypothetical protein
MTSAEAVLVRKPGPRARVQGGFTPAQGDKARLLIDDGGLAPHGNSDHVFDVIGSNGETKYITAGAGCTCPAGIHAARCYHMAAVRILMSGSGINTAARHWRAARKAISEGRWDEALALREQARAALALSRRAK